MFSLNTSLNVEQKSTFFHVSYRPDSHPWTKGSVVIEQCVLQTCPCGWGYTIIDTSTHTKKESHYSSFVSCIFHLIFFLGFILSSQYCSCDGHFMCQLDWSWGAQIKHDSGCVWGCFWIRLAFALVNSVCPPCCEWVFSWPVQSMNRTKGRGRRDSPCFLPHCLASHFTFSGPHSDLNHHLLGCSGFCTQTELHHQPSWVSSLQRADHGTSQPPLLAQAGSLWWIFFYIYKYISLNTYI